MTFTNIKEYDGQGVPSWIKPGGTVAVVNGFGYRQSVSFHDIDKVTATQVVVGPSRYNLKKNLRRMGDTGAWSTTVFLADPDSVEVRKAVAVQQADTARYNVLKSAEAFHKDPTADKADLLEASLNRWRRLSARLSGLDGAE